MEIKKCGQCNLYYRVGQRGDGKPAIAFFEDAACHAWVKSADTLDTLPRPCRRHCLSDQCPTAKIIDPTGADAQAHKKIWDQPNKSS